jgi:hypothetical protein
VNKREKDAKAKLAGKRYDNGDGTQTGFHITKRGGQDVDAAADGSGKKTYRIPRLSDFRRGK